MGAAGTLSLLTQETQAVPQCACGRDICGHEARPSTPECQRAVPGWCRVADEGPEPCQSGGPFLSVTGCDEMPWPGHRVSRAPSGSPQRLSRASRACCLGRSRSQSGHSALSSRLPCFVAFGAIAILFVDYDPGVTGRRHDNRACEILDFLGLSNGKRARYGKDWLPATLGV